MKHNQPPLLVVASFIIVIVAYIVFLAPSIVLILKQENISWPLLLQAQDALYVLRVGNQDAISPRWLYLAERLHKENPVILYALSTHAARNQDSERQGQLLLRVNELDPYNKEYRNEWIKFLIDNILYDTLKTDLEKRGFEGLEDRWTPLLYTVGLEFVDKGRLAAAEPFWYVAASLSPSWSHVWVEYASLLSALGKRDEAYKILERCEKDTYASPHCTNAKAMLEKNNLTPVGFYRFVIVPSK